MVIETVILIFVLRVINYAVGTVRLVAITRNRRMVAAVLASLEALIFAVVIAGVVQDLKNIANLTAYCAGAAVGSWVGMDLEARLVRSYMIVNVFASVYGQEIADALREAGFGVTADISQGRDGDVMSLRSVIDKREMKTIQRIIHEINPAAFITAQEARGVQRGWLGIGKGKSL